MRALSLVTIVAGISLLAYGAANGEGGVYFIIFIPVIYGSGPIPVVGGLLLVLGFFLLMLSGLESFIPGGHSSGQGNDAAMHLTGSRVNTGNTAGARGTGTEKRAGGLILIGPIPIIFGTDMRTALVAALVGLAVMLVVLFILL